MLFPISFDTVYIRESWKPHSGDLDQNSSLFNDTRVGSHQGISNIENTRLFRLEEAWYEQVFNNEKASIKIGLIDLNAEFDAIEPAGFFINPSHGIGPDYSQSGLNGPSIFPSTSMAVRLNLEFGEGWTFRSGIFDAEPNSAENPRRHEVKFNKGALLANEINKTFDRGWRLGLGTWCYTKKLERIQASGNNRNTNSQGAYPFAHGAITENTELWVRYGEASTSTNPLESYLGVGLLKSAPFGRPDDQLGFAIAHARNGGPFMHEEAIADNKMDRFETNFELSYRYQVCGNFTLQPDIQYIINPGTNPDAGNALIFGLRFELSYSL